MKRIFSVILALILAIGSLGLFATTVLAANPGSIWTTNVGATTVNQNLYELKTDVYLNGGPHHNTGGSGLPDGYYYVQVTNPSGSKVLGTSVGSGTPTPIHVTNGNFDVHYQLWAIVVKGSDGTQGYDDTPNHGGVYKVWVSMYSDFATNWKTDVFKVKKSITPPPGVTDLVVTKTATASFDRTYTWGITKDVDKTEIGTSNGAATFNYTVNVTHDSGIDSNWKVTGEIDIQNPNTFAVTANVTDDVDNGGTVNLDNLGVNEEDSVLIPAETTVSLSYTVSYSSLPIDGTNTAIATWTYGPSENGSSGTAHIFFSSVTPTIVDGSVKVTDPNAPNPPLPATVLYTDPSPTTFTYSHTFSGDPAGTCTQHDNTATFTTNTTSTTGSASKTVTVCVGENLTVTKTANPAFTRTYNWAISKSANTTLVQQSSLSPPASFGYTVTVNETGFKDSAWVATGTITVTNPNDWEDITASVTDVVDNGGTSNVTGVGVSVPRKGSITLPYKVTYGSAPSPSSGTNNATATWNSTTYFTPGGSASGTAGFAFTTPTTPVNKTVTISDTDNFTKPSTTVTLGTLTATDAIPYTGATFSFSRTAPIPLYGSVSYTNTATIVETGQSSTVTVTVRRIPLATGALTMGFWQNKNGQAIIVAANQAALKTFLTGYNPFKDFTSGTAANYVTNVIKAANASGPSMNAMLKAQMLATALDVYFSDPGLGGNKIGATAPVGAVLIDLTEINKPIGSATFENVSSVFGPANSLTVSKMLAFAASQSNAGGSSWYGQVKATQELAKDAFDAINNQVAFSP